jgi:amidophosphoribosyltransferase
MDKGVESAVSEVMQRVKGAYSVTVVTPNSIIAFRDPLGIRPLVYGRLGEGYLIASESCAFGPLGAEVIDEVEPGQMVVITSNGLTLKKLTDNKREAMCLFEYIYFARPDSVMNGHLLYSVRERMGAELAIEHPVEADIVVPVPDSGIPAALGYSKQSGIPYREGMTKSRYIHRTFIQPDQRMRDLGVRMKLTPLREHLEGMRVVLVDDSIVRGTTTNQIVRMLFDAGAKEVHVRITAPPIKFPCFYGIDMASRKELIAARLSWDELVAHVGATSLGYLSTSGAIKATRQSDSKLCLACFTGDYPLPVPEGTSKNSFENSGTFGEMGTYQDNDQPTLIDALS